MAMLSKKKCTLKTVWNMFYILLSLNLTSMVIEPHSVDPCVLSRGDENLITEEKLISEDLKKNQTA